MSGGRFRVAPANECASEAGELSAVAGQAGFGGFGLRPADHRHLGDGQAEFLTEGLEAGVVVAALAGGVFDAPYRRQAVGGFVQEGAQDSSSVAAKSSPEMNTSGSRLSSPCCQRALAKWPYLSKAFA